MFKMTSGDENVIIHVDVWRISKATVEKYFLIETIGNVFYQLILINVLKANARAWAG